jgi:16S rRNA (cytidine1402-2'-O)-methyltransferase
MLKELGEVPATLILYESPKRVNRLLAEMVEAWGAEREAVVCRELTKRFEEVSRGRLGALAESFASRVVKGEIVVLVGRAVAQAPDAGTVEGLLRVKLAEMSVKDAAADVALALNLPKREVYQLALQLSKEDGLE